MESSGWIVDTATSTIAAASSELFGQPGQLQCVSAAAPNYNNTLAQALSLINHQSMKPVPISAVTVVSGVPGQPSSVSFRVQLQAGTQYTLSLSSLSRRDMGDLDSLPAAVALARAGASNSSSIRHEHLRSWAEYWRSGAAVVLGSKRMVLEGWWYGSQYLFGSATALGKVAPGLWGPV